MTVRTQLVHQDGIEAELYLPDQAALHPVVVLVLAGSSGGLRHRDVAQQLAAEGVPALALAYFAYGTLPPALHNIPLEYFFSAIRQLRSHPELSAARLAAMGGSRGAEVALQLASQDSNIRGVIATSPSHVRWGATGSAGAAWTFAGQPLPFVQTLDDTSFVPRFYEVAGIRYEIYREWYTAQLERNESVQAATIPIERVNGPLLLFSATGDQLWPSTIFADHIEARARAHGFAYPIMNVQYKDAGHVFPLPGHTPLIHTVHPALGTGIAYGGTPDTITRAVVDRWDRILSFLHSLND